MQCGAVRLTKGKTTRNKSGGYQPTVDFVEKDSFVLFGWREGQTGGVPDKFSCILRVLRVSSLERMLDLGLIHSKRFQ